MTSVEILERVAELEEQQDARSRLDAKLSRLNNSDAHK